MSSNPPSFSGISNQTWSDLSEKDRARLEQALHEAGKVRNAAMAQFAADMREAHGDSPPSWENVEPPVRSYYLGRAFESVRPVSIGPDDVEAERPAVVASLLDGHRRRQEQIA